MPSSNVLKHQLESIWASDLGDRYWALVRSGIQKEPMTPVEEQKKHAATQKLNPSVGGGFGTPGAINAVLVAMTLFEPGTMRISAPEQKLPAWLLANYQQIFAEPLVSAGVISGCENPCLSLQLSSSVSPVGPRIGKAGS